MCVNILSLCTELIDFNMNSYLGRFAKQKPCNLVHYEFSCRNNNAALFQLGAPALAQQERMLHLFASSDVKNRRLLLPHRQQCCFLFASRCFFSLPPFLFFFFPAQPFIVYVSKFGIPAILKHSWTAPFQPWPERMWLTIRCHERGGERASEREMINSSPWLDITASKTTFWFLHLHFLDTSQQNALKLWRRSTINFTPISSQRLDLIYPTPEFFTGSWRCNLVWITVQTSDRRCGAELLGPPEGWCWIFCDHVTSAETPAA